MRVLIVDDNSVIRGAVRNLFETDPTFQVCGEAENGREAIQKTAELRPELVIMDLSMPILNGLDAARGIRRIKQAIPIILFSGYSDLLTQEEARSVGIAALVPKNEPSILLIAAHQVLGQSAT
jgi:DNA-binding NarL/FixJ family response regulator